MEWAEAGMGLRAKRRYCRMYSGENVHEEWTLEYKRQNNDNYLRLSAIAESKWLWGFDESARQPINVNRVYLKRIWNTFLCVEWRRRTMVPRDDVKSTCFMDF